jgi:carbon storage regulator
MLVLSRKKGQAINIAEGVTVTVREISGSRVVLGFEAPREVHIVRQELPLRTSKQKSPSAAHREPVADVMAQPQPLNTRC